tara:strand:+ start:834 stop:1271 length:438 start_codon:yes stop_codon:yes gene_type:complete
MYALVDYSGNQILIKEGEKTRIPFTDKKIGTKLVFDNVLFVDDGKDKKVGKPYINSFSINAKIVSHEKDKKVIVFKKKRRKGYQKKNGHRQNYTLILVDSISTKKTTKKNSATKKEAAKKTDTKKTAAKKTTAKKTATKKTAAKK